MREQQKILVAKLSELEAKVKADKNLAKDLARLKKKVNSLAAEGETTKEYLQALALAVVIDEEWRSVTRYVSVTYREEWTATSKLVYRFDQLAVESQRSIVVADYAYLESAIEFSDSIDIDAEIAEEELASLEDSIEDEEIAMAEEEFYEDGEDDLDDAEDDIEDDFEDDMDDIEDDLDGDTDDNEDDTDDDTDDNDDDGDDTDDTDDNDNDMEDNDNDAGDDADDDDDAGDDADDDAGEDMDDNEGDTGED